jgi:hypothetical protein
MLRLKSSLPLLLLIFENATAWNSGNYVVQLLYLRREYPSILMRESQLNKNQANIKWSPETSGTIKFWQNLLYEGDWPLSLIVHQTCGSKFFLSLFNDGTHFQSGWWIALVSLQLSLQPLKSVRGFVAHDLFIDLILKHQVSKQPKLELLTVLNPLVFWTNIRCQLSASWGCRRLDFYN